MTIPFRSRSRLLRASKFGGPPLDWRKNLPDAPPVLRTGRPIGWDLIVPGPPASPLIGPVPRVSEDAEMHFWRSNPADPEKVIPVQLRNENPPIYRVELTAEENDFAPGVWHYAAVGVPSTVEAYHATHGRFEVLEDT